MQATMTFGPVQVRAGMEVIGTTGAAIGRVAEAHDDDFVIERTPPGGSVRLGYDSVRALLASQVVLNIGPDQLDERS
jgi:hypothetical protein